MDEIVESTESFNIMDAAEEIIADGEPTTEASESGTEAGQPDADPTKTPENAELSPEEILKQMAEQKDTTDYTKTLELVNGMGLSRNGQPVKVESAEQLKDLVLKGFDYTFKSQEREKEYLAKQEEFAKQEAAHKELVAAFESERQQHAESLHNYNLIADLIKDVQAEDPELFAHLDSLMIKKQQAFERETQHLRKYEATITELKTIVASLRQEKEKENLTLIKSDWEASLSNTQAQLGPQLAKLGVKPNWDSVKEAWAADSTGKMSVEQALYAVHGKDIVAAHQSAKKLIDAKNKVNARNVARTGVGSGSRSEEVPIEAKRAGDYDSILMQAAANF